MVPINLNSNSLALALHVPAPSIYDIVKVERGISPEIALRVGYTFGTTPIFWLNLQSEFDLQLLRNREEAAIKSQVRPLETHA
jgi:antitoxin HigA-1